MIVMSLFLQTLLHNVFSIVQAVTIHIWIPWWFSLQMLQETFFLQRKEHSLMQEQTIYWIRKVEFSTHSYKPVTFWKEFKSQVFWDLAGRGKNVEMEMIDWGVRRLVEAQPVWKNIGQSFNQDRRDKVQYKKNHTHKYQHKKQPIIQILLLQLCFSFKVKGVS